MAVTLGSTAGVCGVLLVNVPGTMLLHVMLCCVWCSRSLCSPILGWSFDQGCSRILAGGLGAATVGRCAIGDCTKDQSAGLFKSQSGC
jgi:hypothetical protein